MATERGHPYTNANFLVDLEEGDPRSAAAGFAEVVFPVFAANPDGSSGASQPPPNRLVLRRGLTGSLDLYAWWSSARDDRPAAARTVKVALLGEDQSTVAVTWIFRNARPVSLSYSPLRAMEQAVVMESVEIEFERMEMS